MNTLFNEKHAKIRIIRIIINVNMYSEVKEKYECCLQKLKIFYKLTDIGLANRKTHLTK